MKSKFTIGNQFNTLNKSVLIIMTCIFIFNLPGYGQQASTSKQKVVTGEKRLIVLEGTPYERGKIHGEKLKVEINEFVKIWKANIREVYQIEPDKFIADFIRYTDYQPAIKKYTPDLLEEVRGIAEGCGIDFDTMYVFQLVDEYWLNTADMNGERCSSLGMSKNEDGPSCVAQNMDVEGFRNGYQVVLHIKDQDSLQETFIFTFAGFIATNGINNKGVGVVVNAMSQLSYAREGLPVAFVIRGMLEKNNPEDAVKFLHRVKHASPQNYIIGGPEKVYDFECSCNRIVPFQPVEGSGVVYHTNHPLVNDDYNPKYRDALKALGENATVTRRGNSFVRFDALQKRLIVKQKTDRISQIKGALSSHDSERHPICRPYTNSRSGFTFGSTIMVLSGKPEFHVSFGPPDSNPYQVFKFGNSN